jgi:hypothetical protein
MSFPKPFLHETRYDTAGPGSGPAPHEDLTIAEQLQTMRLESADCPGESCFLNSRGKKCWIANGVVERFIRRLGALHASDYLAAHGAAWQSNFFRGY